MQLTAKMTTPILTSEGFIRTENLRVGQSVFEVPHAKRNESDREGIRSTDCVGSHQGWAGHEVPLSLLVRPRPAVRPRQSYVGELDQLRLRSASEDDARACEGEDADANLPVLVRYEDPLLEPEIDGVEILRGRGIEICLAWLSFENFLADMGEAPLGRTLERNEPDGNYEP